MKNENRCFLDNLPKKYGIGINKDKLVIDWGKCIGMDVEFIYKGIKGMITILNYSSKTRKIDILYGETMFTIQSSHLLSCELRQIFTIWECARWMCDLGVSEEDAKAYTVSSGKRINVTCPNCGNNKNILISSINSRKSISCNCDDKRSYPEKFMGDILMQLGVKFETEVTTSTFSWCNNRRYDFYIPSLNVIIETHGGQHYKNNKRGRTLEEEQENDRYKRELALANGIEHYIELDCRYSELEYIKNSILNSKLNELFDLSKVDWHKCEEFAIKYNLIKDVCEYWNKRDYLASTNDLANIFKVSKGIIRSCLSKGDALGWCKYDTKEEIK